MRPLACINFFIYIIYAGPLFRILGCMDTPIKCLVSDPPPASTFGIQLLYYYYYVWQNGLYRTITGLNHAACHGSEKMLMNAVVKMQCVAPHSLAQQDSRVQWRVWSTALSGSSAVGHIEALHMHFLYFSSTSNALHVL